MRLAFTIAYALLLSACGVRVSLGDEGDFSGDASASDEGGSPFPPADASFIDADDEGDVAFVEPEDAADE